MAEENGAIVADAPEEEFDAESAFLSNLNGGASPPEGQDEPGAPEKPEAAQATPDAAAKAPEDDADAEVEVKVGEETHKVKVKDLTRLYGQEASLTRKSQEVAQARAQADAEGARASTALKGMLERANAKWAPYAQLDWLVLSQTTDTDTLAYMRAEATTAANDVRFLTSELEGVEKATAQSRQAAHNAEAQASIKELENPDTGIKGFGPEMYREIVGYMVTQGLPAERAQSVVSSAAIRMAHKAMMFDRAATSAAEKVTRAVQKPTRVLRPGSGQGSQTGRSQNDAMSRLRSSGTVEDAADAFLASMRD